MNGEALERMTRPPPPTPDQVRAELKGSPLDPASVAPAEKKWEVEVIDGILPLTPEREEIERRQALRVHFQNVSPQNLVVAIAKHLLLRFHAVTWGDRIWIYAGGFYRVNRGELEAAALEILEMKDFVRGRREAVREVLFQVKHHEPEGQDPFDADPALIPCRNCVVRITPLGKVESLPHSPEYRLTHCLPVTFDPDAPTAPVLDLLKTWTQEKDVPILIQIPAQALLQRSGTTYKKGYLLEGERDAGKSTYRSLLLKTLGEGVVVSVALEPLCEDRFAFGRLEHKILNIYDDLGAVPIRYAGRFKALTGSCFQDIERKGKDAYSGRVNPVHCFTANRPPWIKEIDDDAFWSRWNYLVFPHAFPRDPSFESRTFTPAFLSGFLNLIIGAMREILTTGHLPVEQTVEEVMDAWIPASDVLMAFFEENADRAEGFRIPTEDFFRALVAYCREGGETAPAKNQVSAVLGKMGIPVEQPRKGGARYRAYKGIKWREDSSYRPREGQTEIGGGTHGTG